MKVTIADLIRRDGREPGGESPKKSRWLPLSLWIGKACPLCGSDYNHWK